MVVVQLQIVHQCSLQIGSAVEAGLLQQLVDTAVEALGHAVRLRVPWRRQAMLGRQGCAGQVEGVLAAGLLVPGGETVGGLRAVVDQDLADPDGRGQLQAAQEIDTAVLGHVAVDVHEDPAHGAVDGDEQVAARGLDRHLGQVLDIDMNEARLVALEGLLRLNRFAFGFRDHVFKTRHPFALEQARDARAGNVWIDVLSRDEQQVVKGKIE